MASYRVETMTMANTSPDGIRRLPVLNSSEGSACTAYIWEEEIQLVRSMVNIKKRVRLAQRSGDRRQVDRLRTEFEQARNRMESIRRQRLDSLGHHGYD